MDLTGGRVRPYTVSRINDRQEWVEGAVHATQNCDVVFADPDNGIASKSQADSRLGGKYVLLQELITYVFRGQTLVIYHHLNRSATAERQIRLLGNKLRDSFGDSVHCMAMRFRRGSARVFCHIATLILDM